MARRNPEKFLDPRNAAEVSQHLTDIVTKLEAIKPYENMGFFKLALPQISELNPELDRQLKAAEKLGKYWKTGSENLKAYVKKVQEVNDRLREQRGITKQLERQLQAAEEAKDVEGQEYYRKALKDNLEAIERLTKAQRKLNEEYSTSKILKKSAIQTAVRGADKALDNLAKLGFGVLTYSIEKFIDVATASFRINDRFRKVYGGMAKDIGAFTPQLRDLQAVVKDLYLGDLGRMGMSFEEIAGEVTGFATQLEYLDNSFGKGAGSLTKYGTLLGLTGQETGDLAKAMLFMNQRAEDTQGLMDALIKDAKVLGVNSRSLAREVLVLGRNLLLMSGPRFQRQMVDAIEKFKSLGLSTQYLEKFTDMTDSFDQSTMAMARLNTMFGTHISSLQMLAENDPSKRFQMIAEQLRAQGISLRTLNRNELKVAASALNMSMEELDATLKFADGSDDLTTALQKKREQEEKNLRTDQLWAEAMMELKSTILPLAQIMDRLLLKAMEALSPLFEGLGIATKDVGKGMQGISVHAERFTSAIENTLGQLAKNPQFQKNLQQVGAKFGEIIDKFLRFLESPKFGEFMTKTMESFVKLIGAGASAVNFLADHLDGISAVLGFLISNARVFIGIWAGFKLVSLLAEFKQLATILGGLGGGGGGIAGGLGRQLPLPGIGGAGGGIGGALGGAAKGVGGFLGAAPGSAGAGGLAGTAGAAAAAGVGGFLAGDWLNENVLSRFGSATASSMGGWGHMMGLQWDFLKDGVSGLFSSKKPQPRAAGGPVAAGSPYLVGEHGPEIVVPSTNSSVVPSLGGDIIVQVLLDGEVIQEHFVKRQLRSYQ